MKRILFFLSLCLAAVSWASAETVVQYFDAGNPITYCGEKFHLAWSTRPYDFYILQEYLPEGETLDNYTQMFTVSVIFYGDAPYNSAKAIDMKIAELTERKKTRYATGSWPRMTGRKSSTSSSATAKTAASTVWRPTSITTVTW